MASQSKTKTVKFEVGNYVLFSGHRVGRVSRIAKNGSVYVIVLGETTVLNQTREELRVKKADLQLVDDILERTGDAVSVEDYVRHVIRNNISCAVSSKAEMAEMAEAGEGTYKLAPDYIPSLGCLEYCAWEGNKEAQRVLELVGLDLVKMANLYAGKKAEVEEATKPIEEPIQSIDDTTQFMGKAIQSIEDTIQAIEEAAKPIEEPIQSTFVFPTEPKMALAEAKYALRELTFSVTRHSILTAFIDVALNKDIPGYHYQVASNIKNLMAAAFDPVHDAVGYARINTWMWAALALVVKNKERVSKMLNQPIEAAPIKIDRVTKLGMWLDKNMDSNGAMVNDLPAAHDSCYMYNTVGKKLETCTFVVVEVTQARDSNKVEVLPIPSSINKEFSTHLTAQAAIAVRKQYIDYWRPLEPGLSSYCGIVPVYKTGLAMQAAVEDTLASAVGSIGSLK